MDWEQGQSVIHSFLISPGSSTGGVRGLGKGMVYNEACHRSWFGSLCSGKLLAEVEAALCSTEAVSLSRRPGKFVAVTTRFLLCYLVLPVPSYLLVPHAGHLFSFPPKIY